MDSPDRGGFLLADGFFPQEELMEMGFSSLGKNVQISRTASIYGAGGIEIGNDVKVDDFCVLSGKIRLEGCNHIAAGCCLYGGVEGIVLERFSTIAPHCAIHAISDDYSGESMTNPTVSDEFKKVRHGRVILRQNAIIGASCVILPGVVIEEGCVIGAMSLVAKSTKSHAIYSGVPCKEQMAHK
jgi:galactoside O-acetyltransferase